VKDQQILNIGDSMVVNTEINENEVEKDVSILETNIDSVVENKKVSNKTKRGNNTYNKQKGLSDTKYESKQSNFKKKINFDEISY